MSRRPLPWPLVACCLAMAACASEAPRDVETTEATEPSVTELRHADLQRTVAIAHEKMTSLAQAMPQASLAWRPMDGVRSVEEVFIHIAADNYFVPALLGVPAPPETGVTDDVETFRAYQQQTMSRDEMLAALDASFEFLIAAMDETAEDLSREVTLGSPTTVGDVWIRAVTHIHEHLGQSIAYARANEVVPPWSR